MEFLAHIRMGHICNCTIFNSRKRFPKHSVILDLDGS
jgi:hypothetical protein